MRKSEQYDGQVDYIDDPGATGILGIRPHTLTKYSIKFINRFTLITLYRFVILFHPCHVRGNVLSNRIYASI